MSELVVDFPSNVGAIPEGVHNARCHFVEKKESKAGNPMLEWQFMVTSESDRGKILKYYTPITDSTIWKLAEVFQALGVDPRGSTKVDIPETFLDKPCRIQVFHEAYKKEGEEQGTERMIAKIQNILPPVQRIGPIESAAPSQLPKRAEAGPSPFPH